MLGVTRKKQRKHIISKSCVILILTTLLSSCHSVSEDMPFKLPEETTTTQTAQTELITEQNVKPDNTLTEPSSVINDTEQSLTQETETTTILEATETAIPITEEKTAIVNTQVQVLSETTAKTSEQTTFYEAITIQTESPAEPINVSNISNVYGTNTYSALNYKEQKGIWISFLEYGSIMKNKTKSQFRASIGSYYDNVKSLDFNTVYVQVRSHGDAYYDSDLFPAGDCFNGTIDTTQDYDALQIMIEEAHSRGLSVHAWINPMRLMTNKQIKTISDSYKIKKWYNSSNCNGKYIVKYSDRWYLNPAYSDVTQLIADGITEIVSGYDIDGVQIDDYFYPTVSASFDSSAYNSSGTSLSLSEWRINNVNKMVKKLCSATHDANSTVLFGISPQGSIDNNYTELYADVKTWCSSNGYCDYILPQVYFGFENAALPYDDTIVEWSNMTSSGDVKLVIGLAAYKIGATDTYAGKSGKNEWINNSDIISSQMLSAKTLDNYGGVALFRYGSIFEPTSDVSTKVSKELANIKKNQ